MPWREHAARQTTMAWGVHMAMAEGRSVMQAVKGHDKLVVAVKILFWFLLAYFILEVCRKPLWGA